MFEQVLIVDDEKAVADAIAGYLRKLKITVRVETDPRSAIKSFQENPADVVIVDYKFASLTGKTGLDIINSIRRFRPLTRLILISGWLPFKMDDPEVQNELLTKIQVDQYFQKPFDSKLLGDAVSQLLTRVAADSSDWESIAKDYVSKGEVSSQEIRKVNESYRDAILKSLEEED